MSEIKGVRNLINNVLDCSDRLGSYEIGELRTCISVLDKIIETEKEKDIRGVPFVLKVPVNYHWNDEVKKYGLEFDTMDNYFMDEIKKLDTEMIVLSQEVNESKEVLG